MPPAKCERLNEQHSVDSFDCGTDSLNVWLQKSALNSDQQSITRTFVRHDNGVVDGYFALTLGVVRREEVPSKLGGGPVEIPAVVIAKLALDGALQGSGFGADLLVEAIRHAVVGMSMVGGRLIVVDAIDEGVVGFYERHDFTRFVGTTRLAMKGSEAAKAVEMPWP